MAALDYLIRRNNANTDEVPSAGSDLLCLYDTEVASVGSGITYSAGTWTLGETGHFLVIASEYISTTSVTNNERLNAKLTFTLAGTELQEGYSSGYIRKSGGSQGFILHSVAIINVSTTTGNGDELQVRLERIDDVVGSSEAPDRVANDRSGVQIIKLDDNWNYARYESSAAFTPNATHPNGRVVADIGSTIEQDSPFTRTGNAVDIATNNLVLCVYTLKNDDTDTVSGRTEMQGVIQLAGTDVPGTRNQTYGPRASENNDWGGMSTMFLLEPTSGDDLELDLISMEDPDEDWFASVQLVELPTTTKAIIAEATGGSMNTAATDFTWDTNPYIDTDVFTYTSGVLSVDVAGDYLAMAGQCRSGAAGSTRAVPALSFRLGSTELQYAGHSSYNRNSGSAEYAGMNCSALITGASASDNIHAHNDRIGTTTTNIDNQVGGMAIIQLSSLASAADVTREPPQTDLTIEMKTPTIAGGDWKAAVNTNITDVALDTLCHIVFSYTHDGAALANDAPQLEFRVDGGSWADVNASSGAVRSQTSTRIADGTDVPDLIGSGGTFITDNDGYDDVNGASGGAVLDFPDGFSAGPNSRVNVQYGIVFRSAVLSGGEDVDLRIKGLDAYDGQGYARATIVVVGGDVSRTPPQTDLLISTEAPSQTVEYFRNPPQGDLVIDPKTPTQTIEWFRSVPQTDLAITTEAPTVNEEFYRNPPQGDLVIDLKTPTAVEAWRRSVPQTDLVIDLKTPDVFIEHFRSPPQTDLVIDTKTPTVNEVHIKLVPQTDLVITTEAPTVNESVLRAPPQTDLVIDEKIPTVDETHVKTVPQADLVIDPKTPTVNETHTKTVPGLDLVITTEAPNVEISVFRTVPQTDLLIDEKTPDVFVEFFRTVPQADLVLDMKIPGTGGTVFRSPDQADLVIDMKTPTTLIDFFRSPGKLDLVLDMKTPDVARMLYRRIPQTDLVIDLKVPSIFEEITRLVEHADLIIDLKTPTVIIPALDDEEDTHDPGHDKTDWYEDEEREFDEPERSERAKLEDRLRLLYQGIDPDEVPGEYQDALHDAVSPFRVDGEVSPALPAAKDVDFEALIAAGEQAIKTATKAIGLAAARQAALQRQEDEDEAIAILLLL